MISGCGPGERASGGMKIDLAEPVRQVTDQACQTVPGHASGPSKPEDAIGGEETGGAKAPAQQERKGCREQLSCPRGLWLDLSQHLRGLERYADRAQAEATADRGDQRCDHRMQMEMLVRVAMIEGEARGAKGLELCGDLGGELAARLPAAGEDRPEGRHIGAKQVVFVHS